MPDLLSDFSQRALSYAAMVGLLTPIELTISHEKHSLKGRLYGVVYWIIWTLFAMAAAELFKYLNPTSLWRIPVKAEWAGAWDVIIAPILAAIVGDFYFYFHHRIQHAVPLLWRFHAVHHSIREMNAVNAYHHPFDDFIKGFISLIPLAFFAIDATRAIPTLAILLALHPYYLHSPLKGDLGIFRNVIGDNRFHRIHHSTDPRHFGKNYGAFTTVWDRLFGTAYWPAKDEWPEVGLKDIPQPTNLAEWFLIPFRRQFWRAG